METKTYYVGDRPGGASVFRVLNQKTGDPEALTSFTSARVIMLDPRNKEVQIPSINTAISNAALGEVTFLWPSDSVFTRPGPYVMQLELTGGSVSRKTTVVNILVKAMGGVVE
jgi:hypothetical protein